MTTTSRTGRPQLTKGVVLDQRIEITPRQSGQDPTPQDASRVGAMRRIVAARLRYHRVDINLDDVMLIVSEMLTNAVMHSGSAVIHLYIGLEASSLLVEVRDGEPGKPTVRAPGPQAESGRGMLLLDHLVQDHEGSWGTSGVGETTWCRLPLPPGAGS